MDGCQSALLLPKSSASIVLMAIPLRAIEARPPSKFHGLFHEQQRLQAQRRRIEAFRLYLDGKALTDIADEIGVDYSTAWRYIRRELNECRLANAQKVELVREQQIHRLDRIIAEALAGWDRSCGHGKTTISVTDTKDPSGVSHESAKCVEWTPGDPRFLEVALKAMAEQRALLGIGGDGSERQTNLLAQASGDGPIVLETQWGAATHSQPEEAAVEQAEIPTQGARADATSIEGAVSVKRE
jgi:hypothetical protein